MTDLEARVHRLEDQVQELRHTVPAQVGGVNFGLGTLHQTVQEFRAETGENFRRVDLRLDQLDGRLHAVDTRLDGIDTRLDGVDSRLQGVEGRLDEQAGLLRQILDRLPNRPAEDPPPPGL